MIKKILQSDAVRIAASWLMTQYMRFALATSRWTVHGSTAHSEMWDRGDPFIMAIWHGRIMMMPLSWRRGLPFFMLVSRHRDGELITRAIKPFGIDAIRGSASKKKGAEKDKGGMEALRAILNALRNRQSIGITPDGPSGPRMRASDGVVTIARLSGVPIIPATWSARNRWAANSWDRFLVPRPFTRGVFVWGEPILVPRDANDTVITAKRLEVEAALNALAIEADKLVGAESISPAPLPVSETAEAS
jgi:lysophospholipid acyltransferase (LPLAT)-like uncharacterized protein